MILQEQPSFPRILRADDIWINLDQVVSIEEHLGSNSFDRAVRAEHAPEEHYPCVQLSTADGRHHLVPLGTSVSVPFVAEESWSWTHDGSVHREPWPGSNADAESITAARR